MKIQKEKKSSNLKLDLHFIRVAFYYFDQSIICEKTRKTFLKIVALQFFSSFLKIFGLVQIRKTLLQNELIMDILALFTVSSKLNLFKKNK